MEPNNSDIFRIELGDVVVGDGHVLRDLDGFDQVVKPGINLLFQGLL